MKKYLLLVAVILFLVVGGFFFLQTHDKKTNTVETSVVADNEQIVSISTPTATPTQSKTVQLSGGMHMEVPVAWTVSSGPVRDAFLVSSSDYKEIEGSSGSHVISGVQFTTATEQLGQGFDSKRYLSTVVKCAPSQSSCSSNESVSLGGLHGASKRYVETTDGAAVRRVVIDLVKNDANQTEYFITVFYVDEQQLATIDQIISSIGFN